MPPLPPQPARLYPFEEESPGPVPVVAPGCRRERRTVTDEPSTVEHSPHDPLSDSAGRSSVVAKAFGLRIAVESSDPDLLTGVLPWLPDGWSDGRDGACLDRMYQLSVAEPEDGAALLTYAFAIDGEHKYRSPNFALFCDYFENDLHHYIATFTRRYLFVHAGVAVWQGRAIVIPGRSYAGKSTLTRALLEAGAAYYSDDYAIIDDDGLVHPFPRHLRLRDQAAISQSRVDPRDHGWPVGLEPVPIGLVAALRYDAEQGWDVREVSKGAGVLALLGNTVAARERPVDALATMAKAVEHAVVLEGTRGEAEEAARLLINAPAS
jgi:hypothetical protein